MKKISKTKNCRGCSRKAYFVDELCVRCHALVLHKKPTATGKLGYKPRARKPAAIQQQQKEAVAA